MFLNYHVILLLIEIDWPIFNEPEPLSKYTASESSPSLRLQDHRSDFCNPTASIEQLYTTSIQQIALQRAQKNSKELDVVPLQWPIIGKNSNSSSPEFEQVRIVYSALFEFAQIQLHHSIEYVL